MGSIVVIASARAKPGRENELEKALRDVAGPTRAQAGCIAFSLHRPQNDASIIMGLEHWASEESHNQHLKGAHVQRLMSAMANILAEPPTIVVYEAIEEK